jgi:nucleotide-binding universal stress UspA family protein
LHASGGLAIGRGHPEVEGPLEAELRARIGSLRKNESLDLRMIGGLGRVADHLLQIAESNRSDLVVVGTRQETGLARIWHGSVSHGIIDLAPVSVVSVSSPARGSKKPPR